ncbi:VWA domain-containing protein [Nonomuraea sp. NPDC050663]|uniref:VWA domain-containing protein n=1 Tax=Nonomuraea sp. NPDC050663 TaxID=3364370 RepID=UPI0037894D0F
MTFVLHVDQNKYLPADGTQVHAVLTVESTSEVTVETSRPAQAAEVIIVDTSGSMSGSKIRDARAAAAAAVQALPDGARFAVISGDDQARLIYPRGKQLALASHATRSEAVKEIGRLLASGGTEIGKWLRLAGDLLDGHPEAVRHAILMTDGQNNESATVFQKALTACQGRFTCDSMGIGTDWVPSELAKISDALLGTHTFVRDQSTLADYFRTLTRTAMSKTVAELILRVWVPKDAKILYLKQVSPTLLDLTGKRAEVNELTGDYPTGSWGAEEREFHLCIEMPVRNLGQEVRAGWVKLMLPETQEVFAAGNVLATWTDDLAQSTRINRKVAHYTGQAELHTLIQEGLRAREGGDEDTATARLGKAMKLAETSGREDTARLLNKIVEVDESGTARLRRNVDKADAIELDTGSVRTSRLKRGEPGDGAGGAPAGR